MGVAGEKSNDGFAVRPFRQWIAPQTAFASAEQSRRAPAMASAPKKALELLIAAPRGFCAGVDRAIRIVELAIEKYGAPVYVRHEIVHNKFVVDTLRAKGAIFVEELDEVPDGVPVVFSAHGVPKAVPAKAAERGLSYLDATCPLVSKVHRQAERLVASGRHIVFIGHAGHPEVIGTFGQVPAGSMTLIETVADVATFEPRDPGTLSFLTQTTLSVDDTAEVVAALQAKFPAILAPRGEDICYATSNRQAAIKAIANACDAVLVLGAPNSSNSLRLVEVAEREGVPAHLVDDAGEIDLRWLAGARRIGLTAGASAPPHLVDDIVRALTGLGPVSLRETEVAHEDIRFTLPKEVS
jgi:4-hydroxy-3-methylbut-2-enyl diphosphate reductase